MTFKADTRRVMMFRQDLTNIPHYPLPSPYTIGWYKDGDEQQWLVIKAASDQFHTADLAYFWQTYGEHQALLAQRQVYLYDGAGKAVGTVTAWFETLAGQRYGKVNWMLLAPEVQGTWFGQAPPFPDLSAFARISPLLCPPLYFDRPDSGHQLVSPVWICPVNSE